MAKKLNTYVHAVEKDDKGEITNQGVFGPDDDLSKPENAWVEKSITNPDVWDDGDNKSDGGEEPEASANPAGSTIKPASRSGNAAKPAR